MRRAKDVALPERFTEEDMTKRGQQIGVCVREGNLIKGTWRKPDSRDSKLLRRL